MSYNTARNEICNSDGNFKKEKKTTEAYRGERICKNCIWVIEGLKNK